MRNSIQITPDYSSAKLGEKFPKYDISKLILGESKFVNDMKFNGMLFGALKFSDYPRAVIKSIDFSDVETIDGVIKIVTAKDIPGKRHSGLIIKDWPLMIALNEETHYIGDVIAGVIATTEEIARMAVKKIRIEFTSTD
jgi:xanthine dehydrogenase molybdopterin-binding subunit B